MDRITKLNLVALVAHQPSLQCHSCMCNVCVCHSHLWTKFFIQSQKRLFCRILLLECEMLMLGATVIDQSQNDVCVLEDVGVV